MTRRAHGFPLLPPLLVALATAGACTETTTPGPDPEPAMGVRLERVITGLDQPTDVTAPPGDARLFVVEQAGRIRIVRDDTLEPTPFLDIRDRVTDGGERGLLGLAFAPDFGTTGTFYVNYTGAASATFVSRFRVDPSNPDLAIAASEEILLEVAQPFGNHNGGQIAFGPDGMLYIGMGDGGSGGDPLDSGQDRSTLLGGLLRVDVSGPGPYRVPGDNPLAGTTGERGELWAWGLRNPWRFSFDSVDGILYVADVGQNRWEEVNAMPADEPGVNYGWNRMEGLECFQSTCDPQAFTAPVLVYGRSDGCSVTGGRVYRGSAVPDLVGRYVYADFCDGWVRTFRLRDGEATDPTELADRVDAASAFGVDGAGELYVASLGGSLYRFTAGN